jgi:hypothetical protein
VYEEFLKITFLKKSWKTRKLRQISEDEGLRGKNEVVPLGCMGLGSWVMALNDSKILGKQFSLSELISKIRELSKMVSTGSSDSFLKNMIINCCCKYILQKCPVYF